MSKLDVIIEDCIDMLCDSHHGIYIPNIMAQRLVDHGWEGISKDSLADCNDGPDNEFYWDSWTDILDNASYTDEHGNQWMLDQDGDLFAIRLDIPEEYFEERF